MAMILPCIDAADAREALRVLNKLHGYPLRGVDVGGGVHVPQGAPGSPGWTEFRLVRRDRGTGEIVVVVDAALISNIQDATLRTRLTVGERTYIDAKRAAVTTDARWELQEPDPGRPGQNRLTNIEEIAP